MLQGNLNGVQHLGVVTTAMDIAKAWYTHHLGFRVTYESSINLGGEIKIAFLNLNGLVLELLQFSGSALEESRGRSDGHLDHFAIDTLNIEAALSDALNRGATLHSSTPSGIVTLPTLGAKGTKYVFLNGPGGEKVELAQNMANDPARRPTNLGSWNHLGLFVSDIGRSRDFYARFGFTETIKHDIPTGDDVIKLSFLTLNGFTIELVQLPQADLPELRRRQVGIIDHIAFDVNDADAAYVELRGAGITMLDPAPVATPILEKGVKFFFIVGPDTEKIEFNQVIR
jgi:lactoylglutathione lyase